MDKQINKTKLLQFLNGNCSPEESIEINQFLKTTVGQSLLNELLNENWKLSAESDIDKTKLSEWKKEWELKFNEESIPTTSPIIKEPGRINLNLIFRHVAVWTALILGVGIYTVTTRKNQTALQSADIRIQKNSLGHHSSFTLSDGTRIFLGPGSQLSYPAEFSGDKREVKLDGEAYFEVTKNRKKPFIIYTRDLRTQVLGTTFKVTSIKDKPILVSVSSGKVRVDQISGNNIQEIATLLPGQQVSYGLNAEVLKSDFNIEQIKNWKRGQLVFDGTPFYEMINEIERWYDLEFVIGQEKLRNIPITLTLDARVPVKQLLNTLSITLGFNYELQGNKVLIK